MVRSALLALCLGAALPLRAAGPETDAASARQGFGIFPAMSAIHFQAPSWPATPTIHSDLDFSNVTWPAQLIPEDRVALTLALNISGSYEGRDGWASIAGNFDGQGVSLGLLNQCLGQGTLQSLLIRMRDEHPDTLAVIFSTDHLKSLMGMLDRWQQDVVSSAEIPGRLSLLDEPMAAGQAEAASQASVAWAKSNLYHDDGFDPVWKTELTTLAAHPQYVSFQIAAALRYHEQALAYAAQVELRELRAYLMLFDVVVQNGGFYPEDMSGYAAYTAAAPQATSTQKLQKLLALRLRHVRKKYAADVRSRKSAIILGTGTVHGTKRDLPHEYSYDPLWPYRQAAE